ncbi:MAG: L,D-transpeptidase [Actinomycetia bacterium]|nr:L,D-transpeptidase [Actinomycetes bacterium]
MQQSRVLAIAVIGVGGLIGGVTMFGGADESKTTVAVATSMANTATTTAAPTAPAATVPAATVPATIPATTIPPPPDAGCAATGRSAAIDRDNQQAWLCLDGYITTQFPVSTAWSLPDPGEYAVYAKDRVTSSTFGGHISTLNNFVAFTYGENTGARVAFHSIPILSDGSLVQPIDSVGDLSRRGESSGCIRVQPDISELIWDTLSIGDAVTVLT